MIHVEDVDAECGIVGLVESEGMSTLIGLGSGPTARNFEILVPSAIVLNAVTALPVTTHMHITRPRSATALRDSRSQRGRGANRKDIRDASKTGQ